MPKKYEFTEEVHPLYTDLKRIRALIDIPRYSVKVGDLGGWLESEDNLSHDEDCWVHAHAEVCFKARVLGNAIVYGSAVITGAARVSGYARVFNNASVNGSAQIKHWASVSGYARVSGMAVIGGNAQIYGTADCTGSVILCGKSVIACGSYTEGAFSDKVVLSANTSVICEPPAGLLLSSTEALSVALLNDMEYKN